ncbi:MAG TPA: NmrA family NAD(P)-binding protein [Candidatus Acidoferrum sp.]|nr:NmrA family NAD(P)-binding protein [Candidatus Acidoferrum sp.]
MFVINGITGKVGGRVADILLEAGLPVRALVRSVDKGASWKARGCEIALVPDAADAQSLAQAFAGATGVFLMNPPNYDSERDFPDIQRSAKASAEAIAKAKPDKIVLLSTIGAHVQEFNLLNRSTLFEHMLANAGVPVAFLRPAWFMENAAWDLAGARSGRIESYLQPLDRKIDMVSTKDIGRAAADLLREEWSGVRIVELSGPQKYSPRDEAAAFAAALGHDVEVVAVPRAEWEQRFRREGMQHPEARIRMLDGFNEGWIDFQHEGTEHRKGSVELAQVLSELAAGA